MRLEWGKILFGSIAFSIKKKSSFKVYLSSKMSSWNYRIITSNYGWHLGQRITGHEIAEGGGAWESLDLGPKAPEPFCHPDKIPVLLSASCFLFPGLHCLPKSFVLSTGGSLEPQEQLGEMTEGGEGQ